MQLTSIIPSTIFDVIQQIVLQLDQSRNILYQNNIHAAGGRIKMKNNRRGRPRGAKNGSRSRKSKTVSFRLSDESLIRMDEIREMLGELCDVEISRSFMIELLIADERDIRRYRRLIKKMLD